MIVYSQEAHVLFIAYFLVSVVFITKQKSLEWSKTLKGNSTRDREILNFLKQNFAQ